MEQVASGHIGAIVAMDAVIVKCEELERQRDELLAALVAAMEDWEGGYRPDEAGTTMAIALEAIAAVKGGKL
jgi:hypothetical protein